jgi:RNA polymerase sigma-70 factor (ECF subfamily)
MGKDAMDLEAQIRKARSGDPESYGPIVAEFQGRLRAFIAAFCPDQSRVDEVAQRTFIWAYEHLGDYEPGTQFYGWLTAIARNMLLAELEAQRREAGNQRRYLAHLQATACRERLAKEADDGRLELVEALQSCLANLPTEQRRLIRRRYEEAEPIAAIARDIRRSEGGVKVTLFRIRQALRKCVEGRLASVGG